MSASPTTATLADRLPFALPDFTRRSWASEGARLVWEPRIERIGRAWADVEWLSVVEGIRRCALVGLSQSVVVDTIPRWSSHRLSALGVPVSSESHPGTTFAAVGNLEDVTRVRDAWLARADDDIGQLLGYPRCCRDFFRDIWVEQRCVDTTWAMAVNSAPVEGGLVTIDANAPPLANILWRWLGVRAVPHLPCRFDCPATVGLGETLLRVAEKAGYAEEAAWVREMLSWPVEWSALHGIAEIKTPIVKVSTRTDATAGKHVVRWPGTAYPQEGATGLRFPYQPPSRRPMTEGRSFQLGLKRPLETSAPEPSWYHRDNGFASPEAMSELHRPLVSLARRKLKGITGPVLDLGCGNGALLSKICEGRATLTPHGVDRAKASLEHAAALLPTFASNFREGDIFDHDAWSGGPRFALSLLMAGRLLEVDRPRAKALLARVVERSDAVLLYVYPGPGARPLASVARELGLVLEDSVDETAAMLVRGTAAEPATDWSRLAEPQVDHYDTDVVLRLASSTTSAARPAPYRRTPVGDSPSVFDGQVAVRYVYKSLPEFAPFMAHHLDAPTDHPNVGAGAEHVRSWPAAFAQCQRLLEAIHPCIDARIPFESADVYRGSSCHSLESLFGTMWATIYCPIGLAEAIVHEVAHQKLRALGVSFEASTTIVGNDPSRLYVSPIVKDRQRPMTAVLHAQYSYVHVTALDVHVLGVERDVARRAVLAKVLERNLARIEEGRDTLGRHFEAGEHGHEFMHGFTRWTEATIGAGRNLLAI